MMRMSFLLLVATALFALPNTAAFGQSDQQQVVEVVFTGGMSKAEVDRLTQQAFPNVEWRASGLRWDSEGGLLGISIEARTDKGVGTAESGALKPGERFGFRYETRPHAQVTFSVGALDRPGN